MTGTKVSHYEVLEGIGRGGMGVVYRALDLKLNRQVALKVLAPELVSNPERRRRFVVEAQSSAALEHPNIATTYAIDEVEGVTFIAMELVTGGSLQALLSRGRLPTPRAMELGWQIADAMACAHGHGVVHRDLKPANVMLTGDGRAKIIDFGIAKLLQNEPSGADNETDSAGYTGPGQLLGTLPYMSPEQAGGKPIDHRSDIFSFGILLYEMLAGQRPFRGRTDTEVLLGIIRDTPPPLPPLEGAESSSAAINFVLGKCLAKELALRYQNTQELSVDLRRLLDNRPHQDGIPRRTADASSGVIRLITAIAAVSLVTVGGWLWKTNTAKVAELPTPLLAIRSFQNLSGDASQTYFAAGLTEEVSGQLSQLSGLRILSRGVVATYAAGENRRLATELGASGIVEGTVRLDGNKVRVAAQLVQASSQELLWSQQYDRSVADIFAVQSDIAVSIAEALQATLSADERQRIQKRPTQNMEAYDLYLRSRTDRNTGSPDSIVRLRRALALDPSFATARAELAYHLLFSGYLGDRSLLDEGIFEAKEAVRIDPRLAAAHATLAAAYSVKGLDGSARVSFLKALELRPNDSGTMQNLSEHDAVHGRLVESLYWARRGFALEARPRVAYFHVGLPLITLRADDVTSAWLDVADQRTGGIARVRHLRALLELMQGRSDEAYLRVIPTTEGKPNAQANLVRADFAFLGESREVESLHEKLMATAAGTPGPYARQTVRFRYASALMKRGDAQRASVLFSEAERLADAELAGGSEAPSWHIELASIRVCRKDFTRAITDLNNAYVAGYRDYAILALDPTFEALRGSSDFTLLLDRMKRDVDAQRNLARERGLLDFSDLTRPR